MCIYICVLYIYVLYICVYYIYVLYIYVLYICIIYIYVLYICIIYIYIYIYIHIESGSYTHPDLYSKILYNGIILVMARQSLGDPLQNLRELYTVASPTINDNPDMWMLFSVLSHIFQI